MFRIESLLGLDIPTSSQLVIRPAVFAKKVDLEVVVKDVRKPMPTWIEKDGNWVQKPELTVDDVLNRPEDCFIITLVRPVG